MTEEFAESPGLRRLEAMIVSGAEHPAILSRPAIAHPCGKLLRDIAALANARVQGKRFVVFGVSRGERTNELVGLATADHELGEKLERTLHRYIEPQMPARYVRWRVGDVSIGVLILDNCQDAPYLMRKDVLPETRAGDGWIRRRGHTVRLRRGDLDRLYAKRMAGPPFKGQVRVEFAGDPPAEFLRLCATADAPLPSRIAAAKLTELVDARQLAVDAASNELTYMGRLSHARILGCDAPYAHKGMDTLRMELANVANTFQVADDRYRSEQLAQPIDIQVSLQGEEDIECASLTLHLPAHAGITVLSDGDAPREARGEAMTRPSRRYPRIERTRESIRIGETYERLSPGRPVFAFGQPLRVVVDAAFAGQKIPIHYRLHGANLRYPVMGKLYIVYAR